MRKGDPGWTGAGMAVRDLWVGRTGIGHPSLGRDGRKNGSKDFVCELI